MSTPFIRSRAIWALLLVLPGFLLALSSPVDLRAFPQPPNIFWGPVFTGNTPASDGLRVVAKLQAREEGASVRLQTFATSTVFQGSYGTRERLVISGDDLDTPEKEGAAPGEPIFFFLVTPRGELSALQEPAPFQVGRAILLPLMFPAENAEIPGPISGPGPRAPVLSRPDGNTAATGISTLGVSISNFTDSIQQRHLQLLQGDQVLQRQTVPVGRNSEVGVEFEVPTAVMRNVEIKATDNLGGIVSLTPGSVRLSFDNVRVSPPRLVIGKRTFVTVDVSNASPLQVHRLVWLRVNGTPVEPPQDVLVEARDIRTMTFEFVPQATKAETVQIEVGNASMVLDLVGSRPLALYVAVVAFVSVLVVVGIVWLYREVKRRPPTSPRTSPVRAPNGDDIGSPSV